jgi:hypothetical protein
MLWIPRSARFSINFVHFVPGFLRIFAGMYSCSQPFRFPFTYARKLFPVLFLFTMYGSPCAAQYPGQSCRIIEMVRKFPMLDAEKSTIERVRENAIRRPRYMLRSAGAFRRNRR